MGHEHNMSEYSLRLNIARYHPLFTLTMAFPIMMIACIAPFGILIPIESGEKMGYQMTLFLTLIVYLEIKSHSVPVPENSTSISKLIIFFIVIIILLVLCILVTAITLVVHHETAWSNTGERKLSRFEVRLCYKVL